MSVETSPGVWQVVCEEHPYYGDSMSIRSNYQNSGQLNDNIRIDTVIEIIADPFAYTNFAHIRYVEINDTKWLVTSADPTRYPRISLTVGGLYEDAT